MTFTLYLSLASLRGRSWTLPTSLQSANRSIPSAPSPLPAHHRGASPFRADSATTATLVFLLTIPSVMPIAVTTGRRARGLDVDPPHLPAEC